MRETIRFPPDDNAIRLSSNGPDLMDQPLQQKRLKRELRLADLVLMQVLLIVGLSWTGAVAVEGSTHVFLWLAGILLFYLPLAAVVILLSRAIPIEGGAYQWIKAGVSPFAGTWRSGTMLSIPSSSAGQ